MGRTENPQQSMFQLNSGVLITGSNLLFNDMVELDDMFVDHPGLD